MSNRLRILSPLNVPFEIHHIGFANKQRKRRPKKKNIEVKACSNEANMLVQHHPTLLDATFWPRLNTMLDDVGLILNLLKNLSNIMQHCWANNFV